MICKRFQALSIISIIKMSGNNDSESDLSEFEGLEEIEEEICDEESDTLSSESDNETGETFFAKDGRIWNENPPKDKRRKSCNIVKEDKGLTINSKDVKDINEAFHLFISDEIIKIVIRETNYKGRSVLGAYWNEIDQIEINAFFGLLIAGGVMHVQSQPINHLWESQSPFHIPILASTMSRDRFKQILRFIRLDDAQTRLVRRETDKLAAIRDVNNLFVSNCRKCYRPGFHVN